MPKNAECPTEICPVNPVTMLRPWMAMTIVTAMAHRSALEVGCHPDDVEEEPDQREYSDRL